MWRAIEIEGWVAGRRSSLAGARDVAAAIIERVRSQGDQALRDLALEFDHVELEALTVTEEEREAAFESVDSRLTEALVAAEARITAFHELQRPQGLWLTEVEPGITLGVRTTPLARVGAYVPGGRAAYPSTALMCTIPARVAGVPSICCCSPPPIHPLTLVALEIAGVDEVYRVGGAQAIAAMALGTGTIAPVQKVVGPGNVYVTAAKQLLQDQVEIDFPAGPSEVAIVADATADPRFVAADVFAQVEHDPHAAAVLVTTDQEVAEAVGRAIDAMAASSPRREIVEQALANSGYVVVDSLPEAAVAIDLIAPEHLSIQVADPLAMLMAVRNAGSIFLGPYSPVACGDYAAGTNHVLPTAGHAATRSGLDVRHFCKTSTVQQLSREGLETIADTVEAIATAEGLAAHAASVRVRRGQ
ncbi:MAG: histidinol dehydrogenase [Methanoregulaceae archaeon]